jgi:hypothetical protein
VPRRGETTDISELGQQDHSCERLYATKRTKAKNGRFKRLGRGQLLDFVVEFAKTTLKILEHRKVLLEGEGV